MGFLLDGILVALILIFAVVGARRGLFRSIRGILCAVCSFGTAMIFCRRFGDYLNRVFFSPRVQKIVSDALTRATGGAPVEQVLEEKPDILTDFLRTFSATLTQIQEKTTEPAHMQRRKKFRKKRHSFWPIISGMSARRLRGRSPTRFPKSFRMQSSFYCCFWRRRFSSGFCSVGSAVFCICRCCARRITCSDFSAARSAACLSVGCSAVYFLCFYRISVQILHRFFRRTLAPRQKFSAH